MMALREPFQVSFRVAEMENGVRVLIGVLVVGISILRAWKKKISDMYIYFLYKFYFRP